MLKLLETITIDAHFQYCSSQEVDILKEFIRHLTLISIEGFLSQR